jgi:hypothetical protein
MRVPDTIAIELEAAGDSRSMFRVRIDATVVGGNLTAAQAQLLVGDILERIALPNRNRMSRREIGTEKGELEPSGGEAFRVATSRPTAWLIRLATISATFRHLARSQFLEPMTGSRVVAWKPLARAMRLGRYAMFVRFREQGRRLQASLTHTRRVAGKIAGWSLIPWSAKET